MSNFETIKHKLEQFVKRYYTNELLKGAILFFAIGLFYLIVTLFVEYMLWLNSSARTILFWTFVAVEVGLFIKFIAIPLAHLFNLRQGINFETASKLIGNHFPEVNDKLLNVLQLNQNPQQSDLLIASIEQKSQELQPIPFKSAINFNSNTKYLKYAAIPIAILGKENYSKFLKTLGFSIINKNMDLKKALQPYISRYKELIVGSEDYDELYKWEAVTTFQNNWDLTANDLPTILGSAFPGNNNLSPRTHLHR